MTNLLKGEEIVSSAEGLISAKKQQGELSLDLTVNTISHINHGGSAGFRRKRISGGVSFASWSLRKRLLTSLMAGGTWTREIT